MGRIPAAKLRTSGKMTGGLEYLLAFNKVFLDEPSFRSNVDLPKIVRGL